MIKKGRIKSQATGWILRTILAQFFKRCYQLEGQNWEKTQKLDMSKTGITFLSRIKRNIETLGNSLLIVKLF